MNTLQKVHQPAYLIENNSQKLNDFIQEKTNSFFYVRKGQLIDLAYKGDTIDDELVINWLAQNAPTTDAEGTRKAIVKKLKGKPIYKAQGAAGNHVDDLVVLRNGMYITPNLNATYWRQVQVNNKVETLKAVEKHFNAFLESLMGSDMKANYVGWWLAQQVHYPCAKVGTGIILYDRGGSGKSQLMKFIKVCIQGEAATGQVKSIGTANELDNDFGSGQIVGSTLVHIDECKSKSIRLMQQLKTWISDNQLHVNEKGEKQYNAEWFGDFFMTSNHMDALKMEVKNRKFFISETTDKPADQNESFMYLMNLYEQGAFDVLALGIAQALEKYYVNGEDDYGFKRHHAPTTDELMELEEVEKVDNKAELKAEVYNAVMNQGVFQLKDIKAEINTHNVNESEILHCCISEKMGIKRMTKEKHRARFSDVDMVNKWKEKGNGGNMTMYATEQWLKDNNFEVQWDATNRVHTMDNPKQELKRLIQLYLQIEVGLDEHSAF